MQENGQTLEYIVRCIEDTGNDPKIQIYGYINSGNECFITRNGDARNLIKKVEASQLEQYVFEMSKVHVLRAVDERLGGRRVSEKNRADMAEFLQLAFLGFFSQFMWNRMQLDIEQCVSWLDQHFCEYVRQAADP